MEVLNTGHLGYSPEQYYYSLREYAKDLTPQFVVVSFFANDFAGDMKLVLEGRGGDWDEAKYWLGQIRELCIARGIPYLYVPVPWVNQLDQAQLRIAPEQHGPILAPGGETRWPPDAPTGRAALRSPKTFRGGI